ncbi:MAG: outer membrane protein assembly factor [Flavobacterium sp.]|uniref:outer membrane protein assembly factor n=1 Tax=Flavobacterium sp. TaxID=239 RepID=UPI000C5E4CC3|nr:outer membrane protein assembly factor [Flavobacterium sp.]MBF04685.1 outer membrane protein assembly factor [Flavobacterium sp.]|tara:strand:+ start:262 stop:1524 length:1263 start_codon:yes stop_codon:yes gene_type:complete
MKKNLYILLLLWCSTLHSQENSIHKINWSGQKKMDVIFMTRFIQSKVGEALDSIKLNSDIQALTRLNGITKATYTVDKLKENETYEVTFFLIENYTLIPNLSLWTTDDAPAAYRVGLYEFNLLGKNISIGGFYQFNGINSYGLQFAAPYLFNENWGLETSLQQIGSIEPVFLNSASAKYEYTNKAFELLGVYRTNFKNTIKFGSSLFNEKYTYINGATSPEIPQDFTIDKVLFKVNNQYDNLKYEFYLVEGIKNSSYFQFVTQTNSFQNEFLIGWNDFVYLKRFGKTGNFGTRIRLGLASNDVSPFAPFALDNNINLRGVGNIIDRGTGSFVMNNEYRYTLYEKKWFVLQSNTFIDLGSWRKPGGNWNDFVASENFRIFPGVGLRFIHKTIFNAIFRIDYGIGINENGAKGLVFGIGQYF